MYIHTTQITRLQQLWAEEMGGRGAGGGGELGEKEKKKRRKKKKEKEKKIMYTNDM